MNTYFANTDPTEGETTEPEAGVSEDNCTVTGPVPTGVDTVPLHARPVVGLNPYS